LSPQVKDLMRKKGGQLVQVQLAKWLKMLKEEYASDLVKPTAKVDPAAKGGEGADANGGGPAGVKVTKEEAKAAISKPVTVAKSSPSKADPKYCDFSLKDEFKCTAMDLFSAICTQEKVQAYTQSECKMDPKVGGEFTLFGGNVQGVFEKLVSMPFACVACTHVRWHVGQARGWCAELCD
jgi:activator of HSP90 ATPase